jgi:hypothetical protein
VIWRTVAPRSIAELIKLPSRPGFPATHAILIDVPHASPGWPVMTPRRSIAGYKFLDQRD